MILTILVTGLAGASLWAQSSTISGRVIDPQGASVGNAEVTLIAPTSQRTRGSRTAPDGTFSFNGVTPGEYTLLVRAPGFADWTQGTAVAGAPVPFEVRLEVAPVTENITVQGAMLGTAATGKTTLPLREIPITVHGVPANVIQEQGVNDLVSAIQNVPGGNAFTQYGVYEGYTFRGFLDLFPSQAVLLIDGVRAEGNRINTQLAHIERVDVLKGPSSVLYGGSALGATVNLLRKKPTAQRAYDFSASAGSWELARGAFGATGRLGDESVLYRVGLGADSGEGYRHNETRRLNVTPSIAWRAGANDQVNVYYTFARDSFAGDSGIPMLNSDFGSALPQSVFPDVPRDRNDRTPQDFATSHDNNLQISYARQPTNALGVRNTLSYRHFNDDYFLAEFLYVEPPSTVAREYLQFKHHRRPVMNIAEVTARVTRGIEQNIVVGWEGRRYRSRTNTTPGGGVAPAETTDLFNPVETQADLDLPLARVAHFTNTTSGFYAQDHLTLGPQVKVLLGGRFDIYRRRSQNNPVTNGVESDGPELRRDAETFTGRAGIVYQPARLSICTARTPRRSRLSTRPSRTARRSSPSAGRVSSSASACTWSAGACRSTPQFFASSGSTSRSRGPEGSSIRRARGARAGSRPMCRRAPVSNWRVNGGYAFTDRRADQCPRDGCVRLR